MKTLLVSLLVPGAVLAGLALHAGEVTIELPVETVTFKPASGIENAQANCVTCHSADYIQYQPPMPRKFWEAEVKKMQQKYAAPIADDKIAAIVDYLTAAYGVPDAPKK